MKALCSNCIADVTLLLEKKFQENCISGPPNEVWFRCNVCKEFLMFSVEAMYSISNVHTIEVPYQLSKEAIGFIPAADGYDFTLIFSFVTTFHHILEEVREVNNNNDLDVYLEYKGFYIDINILRDPEYSCSYWYFKKEPDAVIFIDRINTWLRELKNNGK